MGKIVQFFLFMIFLCGLGISLSQEYDTINLGQMEIDTSKITISGFSAGSTMATQLHISHSSIFHGVALFSQAYYRCGASSLIDFGLHCTKIGERIAEVFPSLNITRHDIQHSISDVYRYERQGRIDSLKNLERQRVYLWTGARDTLIPPDVAIQNYDFYSLFISPNQIRPRDTIINPLAQHLYPSDSYGLDCTMEGGSHAHIGNCLYSGAYESIRFLLGEQIQKPKGNMQLSSQLKMFNQSEFYHGGEITTIGMAKKGFIYIPKECEKNKCLLHFHFHGCGEGADWVGSGRSIHIEINQAANLIKNFDKVKMGVTKPHKKVGSQTLSRWVKSVLSKAGISNEFAAIIVDIISI